MTEKVEFLSKNSLPFKKKNSPSRRKHERGLVVNREGERSPELSFSASPNLEPTVLTGL